MSYLRPRPTLNQRPTQQVSRPGTRSGLTTSQHLIRTNVTNEPISNLKQDPPRPVYDSSSDESLSASFFLKKSPNDDQNVEPKRKGLTIEEPKPTKKPPAESSRPKTSRGMIDKPSTSGLQQGSDAIAHFAALESRIRARAKESHEMSLTLSDLDLSTDSEVKKDLNEIRKRRTTKLSHKSYSSSSSESEKIDFIKRDMPVKSLNSASVDDTNESKRKSVSFAANLVQSSQDASLDEFLPSQHSDDDDVSLDDFLPKSNLQNVMMLDDLEPAHGSVVDFSQIYSVEELLPAAKYSDEGSDSASSFDAGKSFSNIRSLDDLEKTDSEGTETPVKNETQQKLSTNVFKPIDTTKDEVSDTISDDIIEESDVAEEVEEADDEYTSEFHTDDEDDTLKDTESITHDVSSIQEESSKSASTVSNQSEATHSVVTPSYTETFESDTSRSQSPPATFKRHETKIETAVQTEPVDIRSAENIFRGLECSPAFPPTLLVSNEALAALTSYSPATLALQDMMKRQLALTRDFIERSERFHKSAMSSMKPSYHYTTLEETKKIINAHRKKMNLPPKN